jgi:hypothetical protein
MGLCPFHFVVNKLQSQPDTLNWKPNSEDEKKVHDPLDKILDKEREAK